jgi:hypothetical protein
MHLPLELAQYRTPKTLPAARNAAKAFINFLLKAETGCAPPDNMKVGEWLEKFTATEGNPRAALHSQTRGLRVQGDPFTVQRFKVQKFVGAARALHAAKKRCSP